MTRLEKSLINWKKGEIFLKNNQKLLNLDLESVKQKRCYTKTLLKWAIKVVKAQINQAKEIIPLKAGLLLELI